MVLPTELRIVDDTGVWIRKMNASSAFKQQDMSEQFFLVTPIPTPTLNYLVLAGKRSKGVGPLNSPSSSHLNSHVPETIEGI